MTTERTVEEGGKGDIGSERVELGPIGKQGHEGGGFLGTMDGTEQGVEGILGKDGGWESQERLEV
jgi:hypothetical protein